MLTNLITKESEPEGEREEAKVCKACDLMSRFQMSKARKSLTSNGIGYIGTRI